MRILSALALGLTCGLLVGIATLVMFGVLGLGLVTACMPDTLLWGTWRAPGHTWVFDDEGLLVANGARYRYRIGNGRIVLAGGNRTTGYDYFLESNERLRIVPDGGAPMVFTKR